LGNLKWQLCAFSCGSDNRDPERTLHPGRLVATENSLSSCSGLRNLPIILGFGHPSLEDDTALCNLMTEDLQAIHQRVSLLAS
jgi:hypothetical protein